MKNWCLISLSASILKIKKTKKKNKATNIYWKTSSYLSWLNFPLLDELRAWGILCLRYQSNIGRQISFSRGYFRHLLVPALNALCVILIPCLLSLMKSFLQINKCPSKQESLLTLLGKFTLGLSKKQSDKEDMNWKHLINFSRVIIVWGIIVASTRALVRLCDNYTFKEFFQYSSYHIRSLFLQLHT